MGILSDLNRKRKEAQRKLKERFGENFTKEFGKDSLLGANKVILDTSKQ